MKFSIVTPTYNMETWISATVETVLSQKGDFDIEYIVVNDGGKDESANIARRYKQELESGSRPIFCNSMTMHVIDQENTGMYEAINRGFARATGDVYAWINADDIYEPGAFAAMAQAFTQFPEAEWIKGMTGTIEDDGRRTRDGQCRVYRQDWLQGGIYGQEAYFVEQDSVFWRASLWKQLVAKYGGMPAKYRSAADYWLWIHFAEFAPLWSLNTKISCFRKREGQISKGVAKYKAEQWDARPRRSLAAQLVRLFFASQARLGSWSEPFYIFLYPIIFNAPRPYITCHPDGTMMLATLPSYRLTTQRVP